MLQVKVELGCGKGTRLFSVDIANDCYSGVCGVESYDAHFYGADGKRFLSVRIEDWDGDRSALELLGAVINKAIKEN